uniref:Uncharacterized protein n=1 Tax=uncultured marine virus TaxID=186617 RepID=A0A0F7LA51_9VIRU|nr:hypothetical protein [uncultured marine virus]
MLIAIHPYPSTSFLKSSRSRGAGKCVANGSMSRRSEVVTKQGYSFTDSISLSSRPLSFDP